MSDQTAPRRLTRGNVELRGRIWWNRYREESIDEVTGTVRRGQARMRLGQFRSATQAGAALDKYLEVLNWDTLEPGLDVTFGAYVARFDAVRVALLRNQSRRIYRSLIRRHILPAFGASALMAVDAVAIRSFVADLQRKGLAAATIKTIVGRLREILRAARADGFSAHMIQRSEIKFPSASRAETEQRHIGEAELARILEASTGPRRALWAILGFAGLRIGEALGLSWEHIDFEAGVILVRQAAVGGELAPLKTRRARRDVPMLPELVAVLSAFHTERGNPTSGLLFSTRTGRPRRADEVRARWLQPLLRHLGLPPGGCHAFRHGLPARLDALGLSPAAIQRFMGHSTLAMTEHYLHRSTADLREQLDAALRRVAANEAQTR